MRHRTPPTCRDCGAARPYDLVLRCGAVRLSHAGHEPVLTTGGTCYPECESEAR